MSGETEAAPALDDITVNEMHVRVQGGPRHYVRVTVDSPESWKVDHQIVTVSNNEVVGFVHDADADHFISQGRAESLGRWSNFDELRAAYQAAKAKAQPERMGKKKGGGNG